MFAGGGVELADRLIKERGGLRARRRGRSRTAGSRGPVLPLGALPVAARADADLAGAPARRPTSLAPAAGDHRAARRGSSARRGRGARSSAPTCASSGRPRACAPRRSLTHGRLPLLAALARYLAAVLAAADRRAPRPQDRHLRRARLSGRAAAATPTTARSPTRCTWCSTAPPPEIAAIEAYLAELHAAGQIVYGTHLADRAMMTCLVFSLEESRHVHFIDGADGGYALAALQLKAQLQALRRAGPRDATLQQGTACDRRRHGERAPLPAAGARAALRATPAAG